MAEQGFKILQIMPADDWYAVYAEHYQSEAALNKAVEEHQPTTLHPTPYLFLERIMGIALTLDSQGYTGLDHITDGGGFLDVESATGQILGYVDGKHFHTWRRFADEARDQATRYAGGSNARSGR